ncbi:MAG: F0F1 ATP synthase subunit A [Phycisphaerales bacterium]|jgi:F-type H+-transporting ATPase subunit a|nr:F0F1 ATP synthase subunit A [Phycisphaerales bacterium]
MNPLALTSGMLAAANPVDHVVNHSFSGWFTMHIGQLILGAVLVIWVLMWAAKRIATGPASLGNERYITKNPFAQMVEVICVYLRENTVRPLLHERTDKFMPFLWTLFWFILINNALGLVPILDFIHLVSPSLRAEHRSFLGGTATQNLAVTGALAFIAAMVINIAGIKELGIGGYLKHLTGGAPAYIWPILVPVEVLGTFIKPVALALRLFANMTAGHILVATLFMFVGMSIATGNPALYGPITLASAVSAIAIYFLELFVAFLQAFVFMFLTTVFISQLSHHGDHEHEHDHAHDHAGGHGGGVAHAH